MPGSIVDSSKLSLFHNVVAKIRPLGIRVGVTGLVLSLCAAVSQVCLASTQQDIDNDRVAATAAVQAYVTAGARQAAAVLNKAKATAAKLIALANFSIARTALLNANAALAQAKANGASRATILALAAEVQRTGAAFRRANAAASAATAASIAANGSLLPAIAAFRTASLNLTAANQKLADDIKNVSPKT